MASKSASARAAKSSGVAQDWRSLPKGSPERKEAIAAERRAQAAAARAKKAQERERNAYVAPEEVTNAGESERRRLLAQSVWWVSVNGADVVPPDELTRMLQKAKKRNETQFLKQFALPVLPAPPREAPLPPPEQERTEENVIGPEMEKLRQLLNELNAPDQYRCPKCGNTEDCSRESAERWRIKKVEKRREYDGSSEQKPGQEQADSSSNGRAIDAGVP